MGNNVVKTYAEWRQWCIFVKERTTVRPESPAEKQARIRRARTDYNFFVNHYFPHYTDDGKTYRVRPVSHRGREPRPQGPEL